MSDNDNAGERRTAQDAFYQCYGGAGNFMTPEQLDIGMAGEDTAWELSAGEGFDRRVLFGVTVLARGSDGQWLQSWRAPGPDQSKCFKSIDAARRYISTLGA